MKKKFLSTVMCLTILAAFLPPAAGAEEYPVKVGDFVVMGKYNDEYIYWRCVDIDENGPLMMSHFILSIKPYDAIGKANITTSSHSRSENRQDPVSGSSYWGDSNMRSWLNSDAAAGEVTWLCGNKPSYNYVHMNENAYSAEAGFLNDFSESEKEAIKAITQKTLISKAD